MIKNSDLSCEMNTGHINTLRDIPESCNLDLSNAPKNAKNGPVWVKKLDYYRWPMCHIPYFSPSSFHNVTLYLQFISMLPLHYLFYFTVLSFHSLTHHSFVTYVPPFILCFLQLWSFTSFPFVLYSLVFSLLLFFSFYILHCSIPSLCMWYSYPCDFSSFLVPSSFSLWYFLMTCVLLSLSMTTLYMSNSVYIYTP